MQTILNSSAAPVRQADTVRDTAERLVRNVGRDAAIRMCRSNMWLGVLAEIERLGAH
ncbi:MAG: hypothetical protein R3F55_24730 [Alphaproteobacteria bacterium]